MKPRKFPKSRFWDFRGTVFAKGSPPRRETPFVVFEYDNRLFKRVPIGERGNSMRKFVAAFFVLIFMSIGIPMTAYATDCTKDSLVDQFGDWFGNLGKKENTKKRNITIRKANRLADCTEKQAKETPKAV